MNNSRAFTIIELIVSIVIVGILASIATLSYPGIKNRLNEASLDSELRTASIQLDKDKSSTGKFPDTKEASNGGKGLSSSQGIQLSYNYNSTDNTYCLSAVKDNVTLRISMPSRKVEKGACVLPPMDAFYIKRNNNTHIGGVQSIESVLPDGSVIVVGASYDSSSGSNDIIISKLDKDGSQIWGKVWGSNYDEFASDIKLTSDNGFIITGTTYDTPSSNSDAFLIKANATGDIVWIKKWGGVDNDTASSVIESTSGGYIVTGEIDNSTGDSTDVYISKISSAGSLIWSTTWGSSSWEINPNITELTDGSYVIAGTTAGFGPVQIFSVHCSSIGVISNASTWVKGSESRGGELSKSPDGGYVISGTCGPSWVQGSDNACLAKFNSIGDLEWDREWDGSSNSDSVSFVKVLTDGKVIVGGSTKPNPLSTTEIHAFTSTYSNTGTLSANIIIKSEINQNTSTTDLAFGLNGKYVLFSDTFSSAHGSYVNTIANLSSSFSIINCPSAICDTQLRSTPTPRATVFESTVFDAGQIKTSITNIENLTIPAKANPILTRLAIPQ